MQAKQSMVIIFLLGMVVGVLSWNILTLSQNEVWADAANGGTAAASENYLALTGAINNQMSGVWILKTSETDHSPSLCLYVPKSDGRSFSLAAVRRIKYDFQLVTYNDDTAKNNKSLTPGRLRTEIEEINTNEEKKNKK